MSPSTRRNLEASIEYHSNLAAWHLERMGGETTPPEPPEPGEPGLPDQGLPPTPEPPDPAVEPPKNVDVPYVAGIGTVGEVLNCTMGNWEGEPTKYDYKWDRSDYGIVAMHSANYTVRADDAGHTITCIVTATNAGGSVEAPPSNGVVVAGTAVASASSTSAKPTMAPTRDQVLYDLNTGIADQLRQLLDAEVVATPQANAPFARPRVRSLGRMVMSPTRH